jgi:hypothetical protein
MIASRAITRFIVALRSSLSMLIAVDDDEADREAVRRTFTDQPIIPQ